MTKFRIKVACYFQIEIDSKDKEKAIEEVQDKWLADVVALKIPFSTEETYVKEIEQIKE